MNLISRCKYHRGGHIPVFALQRLIDVAQKFKITLCRAADEMMRIRPLWETLRMAGDRTIFQSFDLNLLAATRFADREAPYVVCVESARGAAIVPAAVRVRDGSIRLLGEELFDYRCFLQRGDGHVLGIALSALGKLGRPMEIVALREADRGGVMDELELLPFASAPGVGGEQVSADQFAATHTRLARNLRRMERMGVELRRYDGSSANLLRSIYQAKAEQSTTSLFHDPERVEFMVSAGGLMPEAFEIFTLEKEGELAAAVVTLLDGRCRRFYTGWYAAEYDKHSPALALIFEITRLSLEQGLDCDYMTGEQAYKMRLATNSMPLYRVRATAENMAASGRSKELPLAV